MYVSEIMTKASITESAPEPIKAAAARRWARQTGSPLVMDGDALIGISTERDVMKCIARGLDADTTPVTAIMTRGVQTVTPYTSVNEAARTMASRWIRHTCRSPRTDSSSHGQPARPDRHLRDVDESGRPRRAGTDTRRHRRGLSERARAAEDAERERWLEEQLPPHHGGASRS